MQKKDACMNNAHCTSCITILMFRKEIKYLKLQANLDMSGSAELHTCQMWFSINRPTPATDDPRQLPDPKLIALSWSL